MSESKQKDQIPEKSQLNQIEKQKDQIPEKSQLNQRGKPKQNVIIYELTQQMIDDANQIINQDVTKLPEKMYNQAVDKSDKIWNSFYKNHKCNFFKDRNYLERQIKQISYMRKYYQKDGTKSIFAELGCGVGNTLFPILRQYEYFKCFGCDISENAINLIKKEISQRKQYENRLQVFTCDLVKQQIPFQTKPDLITMIFVLSAIVPEKHQAVLKKIVDWMKPGSFFYFRDYGRYDFGQINMSKKGNRRLSQNFYMKNDGVCVYYFQQQELQQMLKRLGLIKIKGGVHCRLLQNRKKSLKMYRVWVQGRFYKPPLNQFYKQILLQQKQQKLQNINEGQDNVSQRNISIQENQKIEQKLQSK